MKSPRSGFKFIKRGFRDTAVLVPGWANDYRIFAPLDLHYNYLVPLNYAIDTFSRDLAAALKKRGMEEITLLGFSMGGFLAAEFAAQYPERINELILVGIRKKFEAEIIKEARAQVGKNKPAFLYKFYLNCFSENDRESLLWFKKNLLPSYLDAFSQVRLIAGLDYLESAVIDPVALRRIEKIRISHGQEDKICPLAEAEAIAACLPQAEFRSLSGLGHIIFLHRRFRDAI